MPALLTAVVIVCGAVREPSAPLACRAQVHHGMYAEQPECSTAASREARRLEQSIVADGQLTRTRSHGECVYAADERDIVLYLPEFMKDKFGAKTSAIVHFDNVDGMAVERKTVKKVKGASI